MFLAAQISTGGRKPDGSKFKKGKALYISAEDDLGYTVRPRIDALRGDPTQIRVLDGWTSLDEDGLNDLAAEMDEHDPQLIVFDPWVSFIPSGLKVKEPGEIRQFLHKLDGLARDFDCAIVIVRHLVKLQHENALYQGGGSIDVIATARSALRLDRHPDNEDQRLVFHLKHNIAPKGDTSVFELKAPANGRIPRFKYVGASDLSIHDLQSGSKGEGEKPREAAVAYLRDVLADGPVPANKVLKRAEAAGHKKRTLDRAKKDAGVTAIQEDGKWVWSLEDPTMPDRQNS